VSHFLGDVDTRLVDEKKDHHRLLAPFGFHSDLLGEQIWVPVGFITDFASVPRIVGAWLLYGGKGKKAAVIHDWLYSSQMVRRSVADAIFEEALKVSQYKDWEVAGMYAGVRLGGWVAWNKKNVPQDPDVDRIIEAP
jgi:hypothetical protein